jgi:ABC-type branched-subunit amino acid transport system substrate-binding protein
MRDRKVRGKGFAVIILALALTALLLFTACAPGPPAEEKKVVEIGVMAPATGGAATGGQLALAAELDYIKYFNEELAIPGVTLKIVWEDTALDPVKEIMALRRFVERGVVALVLIDPAVALKPLVAKDELPTLSLGITEDMMYPPGWVFSCFPTEAERFAVLADWIVENWRGEHPPRIAFATIDSPYGRDPLAQSEKYAESIGMEWVAPEFVSYVPLDVIPQLLRLSETADFVYIGPIWTVAAPVLRDAERLGLMGKIGFCGMDATLGRGTLEALGPAAEGYFVPKTYPAWNEMENPGIQWAYEMWSRYHGSGMMDDVYESAIQHPIIIPEAIRRAIEDVGYENLDGPAVKEALETIEDFDPYGFGPKITYTNPEERRGSSWVRIYQIEGGDVVPRTDWREAPMLVP